MPSVTDTLPHVTGHINALVESLTGVSPMPDDNLSAILRGPLDLINLAIFIRHNLGVEIPYHVMATFVTVDDLHTWASDAVRERDDAVRERDAPDTVLDSRPQGA